MRQRCPGTSVLCLIAKDERYFLSKFDRKTNKTSRTLQRFTRLRILLLHERYGNQELQSDPGKWTFEEIASISNITTNNSKLEWRELGLERIFNLSLQVSNDEGLETTWWKYLPQNDNFRLSLGFPKTSAGGFQFYPLFSDFYTLGWPSLPCWSARLRSAWTGKGPSHPACSPDLDLLYPSR